jgi:hypothetical protein
MHGKRYSYNDPLVRLYVRLYGGPTPPTDADIVREVRRYAQAVLPAAAPPAPASVPVASRGVETERPSGIIEID